MPPWEKPQPYVDDEVAALLAHADGSDRVLVLLGAHADLRASEMLALQWADVNLRRRELRQRRQAADGGLERDARGGTVPTGESTRYVLPYRTCVVRETHSLEEAARHLGHASIETTGAYVDRARWQRQADGGGAGRSGRRA